MKSVNLITNRLFWRLYFKVYDRNRSMPYLHLIEQGADAVVRDRQGKYLDLGCGTGNATAAMAKRLGPAGTVIGVDNSTEALRRARRKFPSLGFALADINRRLPFADESFDGILANNSMYLVQDIQRSLAEVLRVLKPGGRFLMSNPKEASSSQAIFKEHLEEKERDYAERFGEMAGKVFFAGHVVRGLYNYSLLLPFELVLKHSISVQSRFWPANQWLQQLESLKSKTNNSFEINSWFMAYAGQNHSIVIERLPIR
jgi:ubiquinone/menaquinone biosynthesis C-methylase UbiE